MNIIFSCLLFWLTFKKFYIMIPPTKQIIVCRMKCIYLSKNNKYFKEINIYYTKNLRLLERETAEN